MPDKDGVSAALLMAELLAELRAQDRSVHDVLDDLALAHGVYATEAFSVRLDDVSAVPSMLSDLIDSPPEQIGGESVRTVEDLDHPDGDLPGTPGVRFYLDDDTRIIVRPSGTEPKLKVYIEAIVPVSDRADLLEARHTASERLESVVSTMRELTTPA